MKTKKYLLFISISSLLFICGCQPSYSTEMVVSLVPAVDNVDPNAPAAESVDPLDVLIAVEKIAAANGLEMYETEDEEVSLLEIADSDDLMDEGSSEAVNVTHWRHPDLPVYLTVTRNPDDILLLLNHTPDEDSKPNPDAKKLYKTINEQLTAELPE